MASTNMLTMAIYLDPTPGGVAPELHLKEGASSVQADLYILDASSFVDAKQKDCVIRGIRPDGSELFRRLYTGVFDTRLQANAAMNEVAAVQNTVNEVKSGYDAMEAILGTKVDGGYVENDSLYLTSNGEVVAGPFTGFGGSGTGGGGGGSTNNAVLTVTNATGWVSSTIASGASCALSIEWSSIEDGLSTGNGSLTIKVGGVVKAILDVAQGVVTTDVSEYLSAGSNAIQLQVMDSYGNSRVKNFTVTVVELSLTSSFDDSTVQSGILAFP